MERDAEHVHEALAAVAQAKQVIKDSSATDTFAGRKTQKPFPAADPIKQRLPQAYSLFSK